MRWRILPLIALLAACRWRLPAAPPAPHTDDRLAWAPGFAPGEQLEWHIAWQGIPVARLLLLVGEPGPVDDAKGVSRRAAIVQLAVDSDALVNVIKELHDEMITVLDFDRGVPLANNGTFEALFRGWGGDRRRAASVSWWTAVADGDEAVHDLISGIGLLRAWPRGRASGHLYVRLGGENFRIDMVAAGVESTDCLGTPCDALRLEGVVHDPKRPYRFTTWITADPRRVPVRVVAETTYMGTVVMTLTQWAGPPK